MSDDEAMLSWEDGFAIGSKVAEMADRVKVADQIVPGAQATWCFEVDGTRFQVVVTVAAEDAGR